MTTIARVTRTLVGSAACLFFVNGVQGQSGTGALSETSAEQKQIASDLYQFQPTSPAELIAAARTTQNLGRHVDARAFLGRLIELQLGEVELRAIQKELGSAVFLDLRTDSRLQPEAEILLKSVVEAGNSRALSPAEVQGLIEKLGVEGHVGVNAVRDLLSSESTAVPALVATDPDSASGKVSWQLLRRYAHPWRDLLIDTLSVSDAATRVKVLDLLGSTSDSGIALRLLRWQYDETAGADVNRAARDASSRLTGGLRETETAEDAILLLTEHAVVRLRDAGAFFSPLDRPRFLDELAGVNLRQQAIAEAKMFLSDAQVIDAENRQVRMYSLIAECASLKSPLSADVSVVVGMSPEELLEGLELSLDIHPGAAVEFLKGLRALLNPSSLPDGIAGVLNRALVSPDVRIRLLAAVICQQTGISEVSRPALVRALTPVSTGSLKPDVVIVSGNADWRRNLELAFQDFEYSPRIAASGPEGFEQAVGQLNCELFILDAETPGWPIAATLANLRADVRTKNCPVVVIGHPRFESKVEALSKIHSGVWFISEPAGKESLIRKLGRLNVIKVGLNSGDRAELLKIAKAAASSEVLSSKQAVAN